MTTIVGIAANLVTLPYVMSSWVDELDTVHFMLMSDSAEELDVINDVFVSTERAEEYSSAGAASIARLKQDIKVREVLEKHNLTERDFPNRDPWGPGQEYQTIIEPNQKAVISGWLNDKFEGCCVSYTGLNHADFEEWVRALRISEVSPDIADLLNKPRDRFRAELQAREQVTSSD